MISKRKAIQRFIADFDEVFDNVDSLEEIKKDLIFEPQYDDLKEKNMNYSLPIIAGTVFVCTLVYVLKHTPFSNVSEKKTSEIILIVAGIIITTLLIIKKGRKI